ncbi:unnamed protein product [Brassicogethes aeneus]|uniref:Apple domain-containing protein n=1 Tax=Brassicogethes aeneus TaxID=1431903 RepID=A0A9P0AZB9_BRAAE|nr:unnamed protein product [Brassicogethes aeneus]
MFMGISSKFSMIMATSLAVLGIVNALTIDNQLNVVRNDCYERIAIGQRLNKDMVYKNFTSVNTVLACQLKCTEERDVCKSFSFGIGPKGNSTCEISTDVIKETVDFKPIGTVADVDFDLYIKKLGCKVVLDTSPHFIGSKPHLPPEEDHQDHHQHHHESPNSIPQKPDKPSGYEKPDDLVSESNNYYNRPASRPSDGYGDRPSSGYKYDKPNSNQPSYNVPSKPTYGDQSEKVQTLVSIASGPNTHYDAQHGIIVGGDIYDSQNKPAHHQDSYIGNMPPFRPSSLNHPYDTDRYDNKPTSILLIGSYDRPNRYGEPYRPSSGYDHDERPSRPYDDRPIRPNNNYLDRPYDDRYDRPIRPERPQRPHNEKPPLDGYDDRPRPPRPNLDYDNKPRPISEYEKPTRPYDDKPRPSSNGYDSRPPRPNLDYDNKPRPIQERPSGSYDLVHERPERPPSGGYDTRPPSPERPSGGYYSRPPPDYERPDRPPPSGGYDSRPPRPNLDPYDDKPRPVYNERPLPDRYGERPHSSSYGDRPIRPQGGYDRHDIDRYDDRRPFDRYEDRPYRPFRPEPDYFHISLPYDPHPIKPLPDRYGSLITHPDNYNRRQDHDYMFKPDPYEPRPAPAPKPTSEKEKPGYDKKSTSTIKENYENKTSVISKPFNGSHGVLDKGYNGKVPSESKGNSEYGLNGNSIVTQSVGYNGESITSIITEIKDACFRRVLAGKRVARGFVKRALSCESVEECQRECGDEKRFICEGFNYRLDPRGRGKGDCELLDLPISRLDIGRDIYPDADYDYYEKDRNAALTNCHRYRPGSGYNSYGGEGYKGGSYGSYNGGSYYSGGSNSYSGGSDYYSGGSNYNADRRYDTDRREYGLRRPSGDRWGDDYKYGYRRPRPEIDRRYDDDRRDRPFDTRRGDYSYHQSHNYENSHSYHYTYNDRNSYKDNHHYTGITYLPATHYHRPHYDAYKPYIPSTDRFDRPQNHVKYGGDKYFQDRYDKDMWEMNNRKWGSYGGYYGNFGETNRFHNKNRYDIEHKNYYLPPKPDSNKDWGQYGGTYGNNGGYLQYNGYGNGQRFSYWGFNKFGDKYDHHKNPIYIDGPPKGGSYIPKPPKPIDYLPESNRIPYLPHKPVYGHSGHSIDSLDNSILPAEPRAPSYDFLRDECSLRTATGFRLHKGVVKKFFLVANIYECEKLCFIEPDFVCASYAYRYTTTLNAATDNCYISPRNYKELDYYVDLEPDRDFDIYTMNNVNRCLQPVKKEKDESECFWRVRSGQRLDHKVVRDSLTVKSIIDCQLECLNSRRFTCRAYSFRYGSPTIGGSVENCLLTDWPFYELDPRLHFIPEYGFEVYERGSYGHGCEPDHFGIRGRHNKDHSEEANQLCYVGYGSPARLLRHSTRKSVRVHTEHDCKAECSRARENTLFQCMSFSFKSTNVGTGPNCELSDIGQRDLLPNIDYVPDPDSWLFAWDNFNPTCHDHAIKPLHENHVDDRRIEIYKEVYNSLDTWRVYSVSGWPCKRGTKCKENREAGFWYCEIEGGERNAWDYCCHPDHQCGNSKGCPYQWCYVGPSRTQWRKCSDRYYPYIESYIDRIDPLPPKPYLPYGPPHYNDPWIPHGPQHLPDYPPPQYRPGIRPNRPSDLHSIPPPLTNLEDYEHQFDNEFLKPPKPGGFGQPRHWPVMYLHKEMPPNNTDTPPPQKMEMRMDTTNQTNPKYAAIQNLINVIRSNDLKNVQYHISNESNKQDDILFVKIPLPTNFTKETSNTKNVLSSTTTVNLEPANVPDRTAYSRSNRRSQIPVQVESSSIRPENIKWQRPSFKRGIIERANITNYRRDARTSRFN